MGGGGGGGISETKTKNARRKETHNDPALRSVPSLQVLDKHGWPRRDLTATGRRWRVLRADRLAANERQAPLSHLAAHGKLDNLGGDLFSSTKYTGRRWLLRESRDRQSNQSLPGSGSTPQQPRDNCQTGDSLIIKYKPYLCPSPPSSPPPPPPHPPNKLGTVQRAVTSPHLPRKRCATIAGTAGLDVLCYVTDNGGCQR